MSVPGARPALYPGFVAFCDPTLRDQAPNGPEWLHEIKTDGYRAQLHVREGRVTVYSRSGYDWTEKFAPIATAAKHLHVRTAILDGEVTVLGSTGLPDFQALRRELGKPQSKRLIYCVFDLMYLNGMDLRPTALIERKRALRELLDHAPPTLAYVDYLEAQGRKVFEQACRMGLEGIVSKRRDSPYRSGRQEIWLKLKCVKSDTFPIVAFVEKLGARPRKVASLYLGRWDGDRLLYAGKARTGYTEAAARELRERLDPLIVRKSPLAVQVKKPKATWVEPLVEAEIEYSGYTDDQLLRAAVFKGLRDDLKTPAHATRRPTDLVLRGRSIHGVPRENILQLLPDAVTPSKEQLTAYWRKVAKRALKHLARRPLKLVRHTHGITFYHMGPLPEIPDSVHQLRIEKREGGEGVRLWIDDLAGLVGLVSMGVVELHPWAATVDAIEHPDRIVLDLDPGQGVEWQFVVKSAFRLREMLERDEGLACWPKLTGGKGVHVMIPITSGMTHDDARRYGRDLAQRLAATAPTRYTTSAAPSREEGGSISIIFATGAAPLPLEPIRRALDQVFRLLRRSPGASWKAAPTPTPSL